MSNNQPKNIVIFSDGTGQDGGRFEPDRISHNSNVYKAFSMVESRTPEQIAFYHVGVGADRSLTGLIGGSGFSKAIIDCYHLLFENYMLGDQIYLFGFSRGAAVVRSLASFIDMFGILPVQRNQLVEDAYHIYRMRNKDKRQKAAQKFRDQNYPVPVNIKFLGVWDTVVSLGLPTIPIVERILNLLPSTRHRFHNFTLAGNVQNAYHALAIDERRTSFEPALWKEPVADKQCSMKQVWFPGVHGDVGGGFNRGEQQLSDIALEWMLYNATSCGLQLRNMSKQELGFLEMPVLHPNINGTVHYAKSNNKFPYNFLPQRPRSAIWNEKEHGDLVVHQSVLHRANNEKNNYHPWVLEKPYTVEPYETLKYTRREG
ncbi:MAG: DUF2235 domain-containing protein [Chloroflexota bacterium]